METKEITVGSISNKLWISKKGDIANPEFKRKAAFLIMRFLVVVEAQMPRQDITPILEKESQCLLIESDKLCYTLSVHMSHRMSLSHIIMEPLFFTTVRVSNFVSCSHLCKETLFTKFGRFIHLFLFRYCSDLKLVGFA